MKRVLASPRFYRDERSGLLLPRELEGVKLSLLGVARAPRMKNPVVAGVESVQDWVLYDSMTVAAGAAFPAATTLFALPISANRNEAQTNMQFAAQLAAPQRMLVHGLSVWIRNDANLSDALNFQTNTHFDWKIGQKSWLKGVSAILTSGRGTTVSAASQVGTAAAGSAIVSSISNGVADPRAIFTLQKPVMIEQSERISYKITNDNAFNLAAAAAQIPGTGLTIYVFLEGLLYDGVS